MTVRCGYCGEEAELVARCTGRRVYECPRCGTHWERNKERRTVYRWLPDDPEDEEDD